MRVIANAPWWLISAGLHVVLAMLTMLVVIEREMQMEIVSCPIVVRDVDPLLPPDPPPVPGVRPDGTPRPDGAAPLDEIPFVFDPRATRGNHFESDDNADGHDIRGDSETFRSFRPGESGSLLGTTGKNKGSTDTLGVGTGAGGSGKFGKRGKGGKENIIPDLRKGPPRGTQDALLAALTWLKRHQSADGSWRAAGFHTNCACTDDGAADYDVGLTGLALLAFLGDGHTQYSRDDNGFGDVVKRAIRWLLSQQDPEGCIGDRGSKHMYNHAIAALALCEAFGMSGSEPLRAPAKKAIDFLAAARNPGAGWRYGSRCGDSDTSVTGWAVMALKSAELSEIDVPRDAFTDALAWIEKATDGSGYYGVGYTSRGLQTVFVPGKNEHFDSHPAMTAVGMLSRVFIQRKRVPELAASELLLADLPAWEANKTDFYYWYYGSLAMFQVDGPKGVQWKKWSDAVVKALLGHQVATGCAAGSWDCKEEHWGFEGGRVYATAINALTLEVYYRYDVVFGTKR